MEKIWKNHLSIEVLEWENLGKDGKGTDTMEVKRLGNSSKMLEFMGSLEYL